METQEKLIAAIDIGTTKIVAVIGKVHRNEEKNVEKIEVLDYGITKARGMKRGMIYNIQEVVDSIKDATAKAKFDEHGANEVYVGISGYTIRSDVMQRNKIIMSGKVTKEDVETLIDEVYKASVKEGEEILHVIPYTYFINNDFELPNPIGFDAKSLDGTFYLIIGDLKFINGIRNAIAQAGFSTKKIIFEPLASAEAVLNPQEKEGGVVLVDIGGGTTDLVVFNENKLIYSKVIPFGGNSITEDIKTAFQCLKKQAEEIKIQYGTAISSRTMETKEITIEGIAGRPPKKINQRTLSLIIQARMTEIVDTIDKFITEFKEENKISVGITITGGGALLKDLDTLVKYRTGLDVRIARPELSDKEELNNPQYATTLGLLIKGDEYEEQLKNNQEQDTNKKTSKRKNNDEDDENDDKNQPGFFRKFTNILKKLTTDPDDEV